MEQYDNERTGSDPDLRDRVIGQYQNRSYIAQNSASSWDGNDSEAYLRSFNAINDYNPSFINNAVMLRPSDTYIDWDADDSFVRTLEDIQTRVVDRVQSDPQLQALLIKADWTLEDREIWEEGLSIIVSNEVEKVPAFANYRSAFDQPGLDAQAQFVSIRMNDISQDIDNGTELWEVDCDKFAMIEGSILQKVENSFLPANDGLERNAYKEATAYFIQMGDVQFAGNGGYGLQGVGYHAMIVSGATGNIIEATATTASAQTAYQRTNGDFYDTVHAVTIVTDSGNVYGTNFDADQAVLARSANTLSGLETAKNNFQNSLETIHDTAHFQHVMDGIKTLEAQPGDSDLAQDVLGTIADNYDDYQDLDKAFVDFRNTWQNQLMKVSGASPDVIQETLSRLHDDMKDLRPLLETSYITTSGLSAGALTDGHVFDYSSQLDMAFEGWVTNLNAQLPAQSQAQVASLAAPGT